MDRKWNQTRQDDYILIDNADGETLGLAVDSKVRILTVDGYAFMKMQA